MPRGRPKKDPFETLPEEWKNTVSVMNKDEIKKTIAAIMRAEAENQLNFARDVQVQETKLAYENAAAPYKQKTKEHKVAANAAMQKGNDAELTEVLVAEQENQNNKELDNNLETLKEQAAEAAAGYNEISSTHESKIKFCLRVLGDKA